jgi:arylsulfatase A-like enzyme
MNCATRILVALIGLTFAAFTASAAKPNILFILADDLGWKDTGCGGSDFYETPNIDRLARQSLSFTAAYSGGANCQPSRGCLMSGQYTPRHGIYAVKTTVRGPVNLMRLVAIPNQSQLAPEKVTVAEALKAAGYATGIFGKWHLGEKASHPRNQGFDVVTDLFSHGGNGVNENPKSVYSITKAAGEFMEKNQDRPFFAYVAHHAIHGPLQAQAATWEKFKAKTPGQQHTNTLYAACTSELDEGVGILLKKLADLGLEEKTLVVFTSDNGGTTDSSQSPLRCNKGSYYEGGLRVPLMVRWPGIIQPGTRCDAPVINLDFYPTFLEITGAAPPKDTPLDGESLLPLFKGGASLKRSAIFWHMPGYIDEPTSDTRDSIFRTPPVSVIRKGDWKLHLFHEEWQLAGGRAGLATNNAVELYNLAADLGERKNLALSNTAKRDELLTDLLHWMESVKAPMPTEKNPEYRPDATETQKLGKKPKKKKFKEN